MDMASAIRACLGKYASFRGRARRAEFWWFVLAFSLAQVAVMLLDIALLGETRQSDHGFSGQTDAPVLTVLFMLAVIPPYISVLVRRLHDTGRSGWWYWIILVPMIGPLVLLFFLVSRGTAGPNAFGPDPLDDDAPPDGGEHEAGYVASSVPTVRRRRR